MTYCAAVNEALLTALGQASPVIAFGQNIGAGSHLAGLTRGINGVQGCTVINTPNCENAQVGFGFGLMLEGESAVFLVKQQDFLLLTLDQLVHTGNLALRVSPTGSFTVVFIVVDSGYEGPQSRLNQFAEICALTAQPGFCINSRQEAVQVLGGQVGAPGFRMIGVSQRLFRTAAIDIPTATLVDEETGATLYRRGVDLSIIACNFALPQALALADRFLEAGVNCGVASSPRVDRPVPVALCEWARHSGRVVVIDDSHSVYGAGGTIADALGEAGMTVFRADRREMPRALAPHPDLFEPDFDAVCRYFAL